jgi:hypothetical protein
MGVFYIHLGVPKTGTTFLQKVLFPALSSIRYFSKEEINSFLDDRTIDTLFRYSPSLWKGDDNAKELTAWITKNADGDPALISEECIHGGQFPPESSRPFNDNKADNARRDGYDVCTLARHVAEIRRQCATHGYPDVKAIVTIRRQDTKFASSYAEISSNLRNASQEDFEQWIRHLLSDKHFYRRSGASKLNYDWFYECLAHELGEENVFFLPYEALKVNAPSYIDAWCNVLHTTPDEDFEYEGQKRVNKKSTGTNTWAISPPSFLGPRIRPRSPTLDRLGVPNRLLGSWFDWSRGDAIVLTEALSDFIMNRYIESNGQLNARLNDFDLEKFGYC